MFSPALLGVKMKRFTKKEQWEAYDQLADVYNQLKRLPRNNELLLSYNLAAPLNSITIILNQIKNEAKENETISGL
jgi:hypothetical protein